MKDFNHIEHDPIPEGLEFNESYMQSAFALYDAEKQKRKRRLLIWWITSAVGFASVLLIGLYFFTKGETSESTDQQLSRNKQVPTQPVPDHQQQSTLTGQSRGEKTDPAGVSKDQSTTDRAAVSGKNPSPALSDLTSGTRTHQTRNNVILKSRGKQHAKERITTGKKPDRSTTGSPITNPSGNPGSLPGGRNEPAKTAKSDPSILFDAVSLPAREAACAFPDSTPELPPYSSAPADVSHVIPAVETPERKHQLFMNLGVNTLFGMKELQHRVTFRESIGISYNYRLNPKIAIGAGLHYHSISRISYKRIVGDTLKSDKTTTILNKTTLNYISFLPQVSYAIGRKHQITAGFGIEYLLVDPSERYQIQNYTKEEPKRTNSKLYYSTFNQFNFSASLGYSYQFSPFMSAEASYHFGFTDITINNGYNNNAFDRNSRLYLGLKIKLR